MSLVIRDIAKRCMWGGLFVGTVYQSYRYPLQLNSSGTSPTYSDTPPQFQIAKFILIGIICFVSLIFAPNRRYPLTKWMMVVLISCISAYSLYKAIGAQFGTGTAYIDAAFWPLAALVLVFPVKEVSVSSLNRYFFFLLYYAIFSDLVEVLLFITVGRLPALAYSGSFSVRFGGFLDDPNGFAALLYMLMGWSYFKFSGLRMYFIQAVLVICILLTQSLTALGLLLLLSMFFFGKKLAKKPFLMLTCLSVVCVLLLHFGPVLLAVYKLALATKSGSINQHLSQIASSREGSGLGWMFGGTAYLARESWWVGSFFNFGLIWYSFCVYAVLLLFLRVRREFKRTINSQHKAALSGILLLSCYFLVGNANLPIFTIFPINFLFFIFAYIVFFQKIKDDSSISTLEVDIA